VTATMLLVVLVSITLGQEPVLRDFFLGFIKIHILHHAAQEPWRRRHST
jgi:hypothetical protein